MLKYIKVFIQDTDDVTISYKINESDLYWKVLNMFFLGLLTGVLIGRLI